MTNLEYLSNFLTEAYGTVCFHNEIVDGYIEYAKETGKQMETLSVYFPNRLDLWNPLVKERLTSAVGENFYERYIGAKNLLLCPVNGSILLVRFIKDGKTLGITIDATAHALCGGIYDVIQYFIGNNINGRILDRPNNYCQPVLSNNGFYIETGANIRNSIERFLTGKGLSIISKENGFYVAETYTIQPNESGQAFELNSREYLSKIQAYFPEELEKVQEIREKRSATFRMSLQYMTKEDWDAFHKARGLDFAPVEQSGFDD